jgi:hypothetical protein
MRARGAAVSGAAVPGVAGATMALTLLTALNFVNYIDRYILPGVQEQVKAEFHVSDAALGSLTFCILPDVYVRGAA